MWACFLDCFETFRAERGRLVAAATSGVPLRPVQRAMGPAAIPSGPQPLLVLGRRAASARRRDAGADSRLACLPDCLRRRGSGPVLAVCACKPVYLAVRGHNCTNIFVFCSAHTYCHALHSHTARTHAQPGLQTIQACATSHGQARRAGGVAGCGAGPAKARRVALQVAAGPTVAKAGGQAKGRGWRVRPVPNTDMPIFKLRGMRFEPSRGGAPARIPP